MPRYNQGVTDRETALRVLAALRRSPVGGSGVLVGSSGLFGFETFSLQRDPTFSDAGAEGYALLRHQVEAGLARLSAFLERLDA